MVLQVDNKKKIRLMKKIKKADQKESWFYYFNLLILPIMVIVSLIIILIMYLNGYPGVLVDTIVFFSIFCLLAKLVTSLLNLKISTQHITNLIGESLIIDDNSITFSRHDLVSAAGDSILVSTIYFKDINKCEYNIKREEITFFADYKTTDFEGNEPVNFGDGTVLNIYDYFKPSLYQILLSKNINVEVKNNV